MMMMMMMMMMYCQMVVTPRCFLSCYVFCQTQKHPDGIFLGGILSCPINACFAAMSSHKASRHAMVSFTKMHEQKVRDTIVFVSQVLSAPKSRDLCNCDCEFPPQARNRSDFRDTRGRVGPATSAWSPPGNGSQQGCVTARCADVFVVLVCMLSDMM